MMRKGSTLNSVSHSSPALPVRLAGATTVVSSSTEVGLAVGSSLARGLGVPPRAVTGLADVMRAELDAFSAQLAAEMHAARDNSNGKGKGSGSGSGSDEGAGKALSIFKFDHSKAPAFSDDPIRMDSEVAAAGACFDLQWPHSAWCSLWRLGHGEGEEQAAGVGGLVCTGGRLAGGIQAVQPGSQSVSHLPCDPPFSLPHQPTNQAVPPLHHADGVLGGGLLSSLMSTLESVSGASQGSLEAIDVEASRVRVLASTELEGDGVVRTACETLPDGSELCPVPWDAMSSSSGDESDGEQEASGGEVVVAPAPAPAAAAQQQP